MVAVYTPVCPHCFRRQPSWVMLDSHIRYACDTLRARRGDLAVKS